MLNSFNPLPLPASALESHAFPSGAPNQGGQVFEAAARTLKHLNVPSLLNPAICGTAGLASFLLLLGLQRSINRLLRGLQRTAPASPPDSLPAADSPPLAVVPLSSVQPSIAVPAVEARRPVSVYHNALHTAALMSIDARPLQSPAPVRKLRRSSDYSGPRRRSTDNRPATIYGGPYRRVTDPTGDRVQAADACPQSEGRS